MSNWLPICRLEWHIGLLSNRYNLILFAIASITTFFAPMYTPMAMNCMIYLLFLQLNNRNINHATNYLYSRLPVKRKTLIHIHFRLYFLMITLFTVWFLALGLFNPLRMANCTLYDLVGPTLVFYLLCILICGILLLMVFRSSRYTVIVLMAFFTGSIFGFSRLLSVSLQLISEYAGYFWPTALAVLGSYWFCAWLTVKHYEQMDFI